MTKMKEILLVVLALCIASSTHAVTCWNYNTYNCLQQTRGWCIKHLGLFGDGYFTHCDSPDTARFAYQTGPGETSGYTQAWGEIIQCQYFCYSYETPPGYPSCTGDVKDHLTGGFDKYTNTCTSGSGGS